MARKTARECKLYAQSKPIRNIGGKLESSYNSLSNLVETANFTFARFMYFLGLTRPHYTEKYLEAIGRGDSGICELYYESVLEDIEAGRKQKKDFIKKHIVSEDTPPEEREEMIEKEKRAIHRVCMFKYKEAVKQYRKHYYWSGAKLSIFEKRYLEHAKSLLYLTEDGLEIDPEKFIAFYESFIAADESETKQQHQAAADAINRFFNGKEITEKELFRYFKIEDGILKVNLSSVNLDSYSRLGQRNITVTKAEEL